MTNPTLTREQAETLARSRGCTDEVIWLMLRSKQSVYGENDAYTDTAGLVTPDGYTEYKVNTLPTVWKQDIACLVPGDYKWRKGIHGQHHIDQSKPADKAAFDWLLAHEGQDHPDPAYRLTYWAFREVPPMTVIRCGHSGTFTDSAANPFWVDGHHGGLISTSSEACQTWPVAIWHAVRAAGYAAMDKYEQKEITLALHLVD